MIPNLIQWDARTRFETRASEDGKTGLIRGYAAVFDVDSEPLGWAGFVETIAPGAFEDSISGDDIRALWNHSTDLVLGRTKAGTLTLEEDEIGLRYAIDVDLENTAARDVWRMIDRGDVTGSSFGFDIRSEIWEYPDEDDPGDPLRHRLLDVKLYEVSPVPFPAYPQTESETARARFLESVGRVTGQPSAELAELNAPQLRALILGTSIFDDDEPEPEPQPREWLQALRDLEARRYI